MPSPAIAILWKGPGGTSCVVTRRGTVLVLTLERNGQIEREQEIESPREAMELAARWRTWLQKS